MKWTTILCITILFLSSAPSCVEAQTPAAIEEVKGIFKHKRHKHYHAFARNNDSGLKLIFSGLFLAYKEFISSQDGQSCSFTPSCSEYALLSIKKKGIFFGAMNAFDRLTRCNGISPEHYERDPKTNLLYDPL